MKGVLLFSIMLICASLDAAQVTDETRQKWSAGLGASEFERRQTTAAEIWGSGEEAKDFLRGLVEGTDPELVNRAADLLKKIELGITPDTPQKVVALIEKYLSSGDLGKVAVLENLLSIEEYDIFLRLQRNEESVVVRDRIDDLLADLIPRILNKQLAAGKVKESIEILRLTRQFEQQLRLGNLLEVVGELDDEIARLKESENADDQARYLVMLRVKGDAELLRKEAKRLGDRDAEVLAALVMGDYRPLLEWKLEVEDSSLSERSYRKWQLARERGDLKEANEWRDRLAHLTKDDGEEESARMFLFMMGEPRLAMDGVEGFEDLFVYHLSEENYAKAAEMLGFENGKVSEGWFEKVKERVTKEWEASDESEEATKLSLAVGFLEGRGMVAEATKGALLLFDLVRANDEQETGTWASGMFFMAPQAVAAGLAVEIDEHGADVSGLFESLYGGSEEREWLYVQLKKVFPKMSTEERLLQVISLTGRRLLVPEERYREVRSGVIEKVKADEETRSGLTKLLFLNSYRNREVEIVELLDLLTENGDPNFLYGAMVALDGFRFETAAKNLEGFEGNIPNPPTNYFLGVALDHCEKEKGKEYLEKAWMTASGTSDELTAFAHNHLRFGEFERAHELYQRAFLRLESPSELESLYGRANLVSSLAYTAKRLGKWREVKAYGEISVTVSSYASVQAGVFVMRERFQILLAEAALAMEGGEIVKAAQKISEAHALLPRDGYLANDLFPLVRQLGLRELHDQLFAVSARACRESLQMFPEDDNLYNNFAWLASRANRSLDEAEGYLKKALEMNPESAAYLDTMAEIYFARGDRETAVLWSEKSLRNDVVGSEYGRWELQDQHRRFMEGEFPTP